MVKIRSDDSTCSEDNVEIRLIGKRERRERRRLMKRETKRKRLEEEEEKDKDHHHHQHQQYDYPTEITMDIFCRLPFESISECRGVCKTWRTLILDPQFAHTYLKHRGLMTPQHYYYNYDEHQPHSISLSLSSSSLLPCSTTTTTTNTNDKKVVGCLFLCRATETREGLYYGEYDVNDDNDEPQQQQQQEQSFQKVLLSVKKINHRLFKKNRRSIVGSCNGLICLASTVLNVPPHYVWSDPVYIYNPVTLEYLKLPKLNEVIDVRKKVANGTCCIYFGFGYHHCTNEYKVVRIIYDHNNLNLIYPLHGKVQVYTLGAGTGWREKGIIPYILGFASKRSKVGVMANGALHWVDNKGEIVAFDLAKEEFHLLPSPADLTKFSPFREIIRLWVLEGVLYLVHEVDAMNIAIWSLKKKKKEINSYNMKALEYQSKSWSLSWSREFTGIRDDIINVHPLFVLTKSGEIVLLRGSGGQTLYRYDPKESTPRAKEFGNLNPALFIREAVPHVNSFVPLKALGEDAKIIRPLVDGTTRREDEDDKNILLDQLKDLRTSKKKKEKKKDAVDYN